jgi:hypothetical protein
VSRLLQEKIEMVIEPLLQKVQLNLNIELIGGTNKKAMQKLVG